MAVWGVARSQGVRPAVVFFPLGYPFPYGPDEVDGVHVETTDDFCQKNAYAHHSLHPGKAILMILYLRGHRIGRKLYDYVELLGVFFQTTTNLLLF
jgi:hypothetical protein